jgi:hypothetical protein
MSIDGCMNTGFFQGGHEFVTLRTLTEGSFGSWIISCCSCKLILCIYNYIRPWHPCLSLRNDLWTANDTLLVNTFYICN